MQVRSFLMTMGAGVAMGALGAMMLPKNSEVYKQTKKAANAIRREAETAIDSISFHAVKSCRTSNEVRQFFRQSDRESVFRLPAFVTLYNRHRARGRRRESRHRKQN